MDAAEELDVSSCALRNNVGAWTLGNGDQSNAGQGRQHAELPHERMGQGISLANASNHHVRRELERCSHGPGDAGVPNVVPSLIELQGSRAAPVSDVVDDEHSPS